MPLATETQLTEVIDITAALINSVRAAIGDLGQLPTNDKDSIVESINELEALVQSYTASSVADITAINAQITTILQDLNDKIDSSALASIATSGSYDDLSGVPSDFNPSPHTHTSSEITDFNAAVDSHILSVTDGAPAALDTLNELAAALGDDPNFATTITSLIALKANTDDLNSVATSGDYNDLSNTPPPAPVDSVNSQTGAVVLNSSDVGLDQVDNTSDADKPISTTQQAAFDDRYTKAEVDPFVLNINQSIADLEADKLEASDIADFETSTQLNSRDAANRERANHTGTQLANTISDFENAVRQIYDTTIDINNAEVTASDNANPVAIHNVQITPQHSGLYSVRSITKCSYNITTSDGIVTMKINGNQVDFWRKEPKDSGGADGSSGTNQRETALNHDYFNATAGVPFQVLIEIAPESNNVVMTSKKSTLEIKRLLEV